MSNYSLLSTLIRSAWKTAGVELVGPLHFATLKDTDFFDADGALLDVGVEAPGLFALSESLAIKQIPFLYVMTMSDVVGRVGFPINDQHNDITVILHHLFHLDDGASRH